MFCFRYFGFKTLKEVGNMTMKEFRLLAKAHALAEIDKDYRMYMSAFQNMRVQDVKEVGSGSSKRYQRVYRNFTDFYDYQKAIEAVNHPQKSTQKRKTQTPADRYFEYLKMQKQKQGGHNA